MASAHGKRQFVLDTILLLSQICLILSYITISPPTSFSQFFHFRSSNAVFYTASVILFLCAKIEPPKLMAPHSLFKHHTLSLMPISAPPFSPISSCSVTQLHPNLCNLLDCSVPGLPVPHLLLELAHVHVHWIRDDIQPSHPLMTSSPSALSLSQHQGLFQWVVCSLQMTKILELQLQQ